MRKLADEEICPHCSDLLEDGECKNENCPECPTYEEKCSECGSERDENGGCTNADCSKYPNYEK